MTELVWLLPPTVERFANEWLRSNQARSERSKLVALDHARTQRLVQHRQPAKAHVQHVPALARWLAISHKAARIGHQFNQILAGHTAHRFRNSWQVELAYQGENRS